MSIEKVAIMILDGVGVGELPDADEYGDVGSNTLGNLATAVGGCDLPNFQKLGLGNIIPLEGVEQTCCPLAAFGKMAEQSAGKDSTSGHWEIAGTVVETPFPTYPNGFPDEMIEIFSKKIGRGILGNKPASGTVIIQELGDEHCRTGKPIVYTSADSVFQIAAHEQIIPLKELYRICEIARHEVCVADHAVGRVIARPFIGPIDGEYVRTKNRHDFSLEPLHETILDILKKNHIPTIAIGKIYDLYAGKGISQKLNSDNNSDGMNQFYETIHDTERGLIMVNLVDFDMLWGHRNDTEGFYRGLQEVDKFLPKLLEIIDESTRLIITADHGNDPTTPSTDHSREYVPLMVYGGKPANLGVRDTFADIAATLSDWFEVSPTKDGESFARLV
jgi:phosphopentomutase